LSLSRTITDHPQLVAVQLDHGAHTGGQHPFTVVLVEQILFPDALGQHHGQLGREVRRIDMHGKRDRRRRRAGGTCLDADLGHG
jgi:hypothetical protein